MLIATLCHVRLGRALERPNKVLIHEQGCGITTCFSTLWRGNASLPPSTVVGCTFRRRPWPLSLSPKCAVDGHFGQAHIQEIDVAALCGDRAALGHDLLVGE